MLIAEHLDRTGDLLTKAHVASALREATFQTALEGPSLAPCFRV